MTRSVADFEAYAAAHPKGHRPCFVCSIPERNAVEDAKAKGISVRNIVGTLVNVYHYPAETMSLSRIHMHFARDHHLRPKAKKR